MATSAPATCESCGTPDDHLASVHRVYVTPEAWDQQEKVEVVDDVEQWCVPCRTMYPHQPA
jgi:thiol-disulfide isomerase/thioredoxin